MSYQSSVFSLQSSELSTQYSVLSTFNSELGTQYSVLSTQYLTIGYRHPRRPPRVVVENINVSLKPGELVCLIGPNGAGKSTLMRTLAGMQPPLSGSISIMGDDLAVLTPRDLAQRLSIVLTERVDVGILPAYALVALGRYPYTDWTGALTSDDEAIVQWAIEAVGASDLAARSVDELSDGERQKILIARALAQQPDVVLLDEPTAFLDLPRRAEMMQLLRRLARDTYRAILLSTHDLDLALRSADQIWLLPKGGPLQAGAPEDLVLSGAFEAAFRSEGVTFDAFTGAFRVAAQPAGVVDVVGEGIPALWTVRALEREGFCPIRNGADAPIRITVVDNHRWLVTNNGKTREYTSLYEVAAFLRSHLP
ncbi:MAG: ABC transporter ATP-binding protein [Chloroflexi bacterium]|nr:ABC transporter ATP-binding protein [Chloroflexota bacterium]